jgi:predicted acylesterase/phospholipase RssA
MDKTFFFKSCLAVFQGGGCRAAAFAGAYEEAVRRGVSISEVAGTSAGSIIAALIGAGATPDFVRTKLTELDFQSFLQRPDRRAKRGFWRIANLLSQDYADLYFERLLSELLPNERRPIAFKSLPFPTYIVSTDLVRSEAKVWNQETTPNELVSDAVRASCSIPIFFQPIDRRHVDGGLLSNLPAYVFASPGRDRALSSKILAFALVSRDADLNKWDTRTFLLQLASTLVDGGQQLQLNLQPNVHVINIQTGAIQATDFDKMTPEVTQELIKSGIVATRDFFDSEQMHIRSANKKETTCADVDEFYSRITEVLTTPIERLIVAEHNTDWVYSLFPTILSLRARGVTIDAVLPQNGDRPGDGPYRRRLLNALGANLTVLAGESFVPLRATIVVPQDKTQTRVIVGVDKQPKVDVDSVVYQGYLDAGVIKVAFDKIDSLVTSSGVDLTVPFLVRVAAEEVINPLRFVGQYSKENVSIGIETVHVQQLAATSRFTREYKYNQIRYLIDMYRRLGFELFEPVAVQFANGLKSIVTPPVVEEAGGRFILIEGSTRATFCRDEGIPSFKCIVVRGVSDPVPSSTFDFSKVRITGRRLPVISRYEGFEYSQFRHIERAMHPIDSLE